MMVSYIVALLVLPVNLDMSELFLMELNVVAELTVVLSSMHLVQRYIDT